MPELKDVLDDVQREVKSFGDNVKGLKDSMEKDLKAVRDIAEAAGKNAVDGTQIKKDLEALATGVAEKHSAVEAKAKELVDGAMKAFTDRADDLEKKLNRSRLNGGADGSDKAFKSARDFTRTAMAVRGELKVGTDLSDDKIDLPSVKSYTDAYPLYLRRDEKNLQGAELKAMSVGSDPDGGYLVTPTIGGVINGVIFETSPMRQIANIETIGSDAIEFPRDDDQASAGWVGEQESRTETGTPQVGMQRIPAHELYAMPKATQKFLEDANIDVEAWLGKKLGDRFGRLEATAFVSGNGIKQPRGFLTYASGSFAAGSVGKIEQISSGTSGAVGFDDLIKVLNSLKEYYLSGANWMLQRATVGTIMLIKDLQNRYIWEPNVQAGKPSVLLGYDVRQAADMPSVASGALPIAFGNFKEGYTIVDRVGISTLRDPYSAKPFVQFYTRKRVGGDVTNFEAIKLLAVQ